MARQRGLGSGGSATLQRFPGQWHRIELRHLLTLDAVAEEGSFGRAAARLGYVQSAISQQLAALESFLGTRLVNRTRGARGAELTPEGLQFLQHARAILGEMRAAAANIESHEGEAHAVRVAAQRDVGVSALMLAFAKTPANGGPRPYFEVEEGLDRDKVLTMIEIGACDFGCVVGKVPSTFGQVELYRDQWVVAVHKGHSGGPATLDEIAGQRLVTLRGITAMFPLARLLPEAAATTDNPATLLAMIEGGLGVGVVPESLVQTYRGQVILRPIRAQGADLTLVAYLVWRRRRPIKPALRLLIDLLNQHRASVRPAA
jgi:DNA-binding transcriptional LysR family regulator